MLLLMTYPYNYAMNTRLMKKHNQQFSAVWGRMDTYICMTESLHCSPETITRLLTDYTPIENVFGV